MIIHELERDFLAKLSQLEHPVTTVMHHSNFNTAIPKTTHEFCDEKFRFDKLKP